MKILVIGPSWIGDMMMSQSLYRTIKTKNSDTVIDVMAPPWSISLLRRMTEVNKILSMPIGHCVLALRKRYCLGKSLKNSGYDRAYVLPNSFKSALIPFFAQIKHRIGWQGEMRYGILNDIRMLDKSAFPMMVDRYIALGYDQLYNSAKQLPQPLMWPQLKVDEYEKYITSSQFALSTTRPIIGFCPGAEFGPAKCWPYYHYAVLAEKLIREGYEIILLGSQKDSQTGIAIMQHLSNSTYTYCKNLIGKTNLEQAVILLAQCTAVVSNDSGLMHIAAALNRLLVVLYGPSSSNFTPPLSYQARIINMNNDYHKIRYGCDKNGYHQSLIDINPSYVYKELIILMCSVKS